MMSLDSSKAHFSFYEMEISSHCSYLKEKERNERERELTFESLLKLEQLSNDNDRIITTP